MDRQRSLQILQNEVLQVVKVKLLAGSTWKLARFSVYKDLTEYLIFMKRHNNNFERQFHKFTLKYFNI